MTKDISFDILIDTKEKIPWEFTDASYVDNIEHVHLDTGDYTIVGFEDTLCIERKRSVAEFAKNITEERFKRELERMREFPHKFIIFEFNYSHIDDYPLGSSIPKAKHKHIRVKGPFIRAAIARMEVEYGIHVIPCGHAAYAEEKAGNIMKEIYRKYSGQNT